MHETELLVTQIVERWDDLGGRAAPWAPLNKIHEELFAGRELTPVDYAAVEEAHWGIYSLGHNLYSHESWHMLLKGDRPPRQGWAEPWFPEAQRAASERYAKAGTDEVILPADWVPNPENAVELRLAMPFGSQLDLPAGFGRMDPNAARMVLYGMNKFSTPMWHDPYLMLREVLEPYRSQQ